MGSGVGVNTSAARSSIKPLQGLLSDTVYLRMLFVVLGLDRLAGVLTAGANIINLTVYIKMGTAESTNISLAALAISDLGIAVTAVVCVLGTVVPFIPNASFTHEISMPIGVYPHFFFLRISALITTYISMEQYLCVKIPLKIKTIITNRRTLIVMIIIFGSLFCSYPIAFLTYPLGWRFDPEKNRTVLSVILHNDPMILLSDKVLSIITLSILPYSTFVLVSVIMILLSVSIQKSKTWRDANKFKSSKTEGFSDAERIQSKEARVVKMVILIEVVFIVTNISECVHAIVGQTVTGFTIKGRYARLFEVLGMFFFFKL